MDSKLYVGNISWEATEQTLKDFLAEVGEVVSVKIITDRTSGRSKGFGFVEMRTQEDAEKVISEVNGKDFLGRNLKINIARPQKSRRPRGNFGGGTRRKY